MTRPSLIAAAVLVAVLSLPAGASGAGGTYEVVQCSAENRNDEAQILQPRAYNLGTRCSVRSEAHAMKIDNVFPATTGVTGEFSWTAPPQTGFVGVRVAGKLRRQAGHHAHLVMADRQGRETYRVGVGNTRPSRFRQWSWHGAPQGQFAARLTCKRNGGCRQSNAAKTWIKNVRLTLEDLADPEVEASGSMLGAGWLTGELEIGALVSDGDSGIASARIAVNGVSLDEDGDASCHLSPDGATATRLSPCPPRVALGQVAARSDDPPFRDGINSVEVCAHDYGQNRTCEVRTVRVDTTPPTIAFSNAQIQEDPELVRASVQDVHAGVESGQIYVRPTGEPLWKPVPTRLTDGELQTRVDSSAYSEGSYEFRAVARDAAGNRTETALKENGLPMVLDFPLRAGVTLNARIEPGGQRRVVLPYGRARRAAGRLMSRDGEPLADREIRVEEYFGEGALIDRRVRTVTTDEDGRWRSRLPPGPSRRVRAYYDGDVRYLDGDARAGSVRVMSKAVFKTSRRKVAQGRRVVFRGRIARRGARIPNGGKLVELQVRERPGRWSTVREAFRTKPQGRYRLRYRFGRFYVRNVRFRFRIKVAREGDWPYRAATSRARNVTVLAR